jgi:Zn-dependent protease with chaperone function
MLILAALAFGDSLGNILFILFSGTGRFRDFKATVDGYVTRWWSPSPQTMSPAEVTAIAREGSSLMTDKFAPLMALFVTVPGILLLTFVCVAVVLYRRHAGRIKRFYQSKPLTKIEAPNVVADLEECVARHGLAIPRLEYSPGLAQGHAFGIKGEEVLLLQGTPAMLEKTWKETNRAVALHELGHIANGDTQEREKAKALWTVFTVFLVFGLFVFWMGLGFPAVLVLKSLAMLVLVRAIWSGLIRVREFYADWRAASWGAGPALQRLLSLTEGESCPWERWGWWWRAWERWGEQGWWRTGWGAWERIWRRARRVLQLHPSFSARSKVLGNPDKLFRISTDLPLLTGVLMTLVLVGALFFVLKVLGVVLLVLGLLDGVFLRWLGGMEMGSARTALVLTVNMIFGFVLFLTFSAMLMAVAYLVVKALGVQVQRQAVADLATGRSESWGYARLLLPAFLLAIGMEIGFWIAPFSVFVPGSVESRAGLPVWLAGITVLMWLWLAYTHGLSRFVLGSYVGSANPRRRRNLVTWSSIAVLTVLFWPAALARLTVQLSPLLKSKAWLPLHTDGQTFFIYGFFMTTLVLLILAICTYLFWVLVTLVALRIGPLRRRGRCPSCNAYTPYTLSLGRRCHSCGESLTPWIFISTMDGVSGGSGQ